jgi:hypothetical protein
MKVTRMSDFIKCPQCKAAIPLTEVIEHQINEQLRQRLDHELEERNRKHAAALEAKEHEVRRLFAEERAEREAEIKARAEQKRATELADLMCRVEEQSAELQSARELELQLRQAKRKLEDERNAIELEVARKLDRERKKITAQARESLSEAHQLELRQKNIEVEQMKKQIKELQESSEQLPSGLRGEALEREIEHVLRESFSSDRIEPVKSGLRGADVLQTVLSRGRACGTILWEFKRARHWSNEWTTKLRRDQAAANADVAVLVCAAPSPGLQYMDLYDGVWVVDPVCVIPIAKLLRERLTQLTQVRSVDSNRNDAMEALYEYLSSNAFARRIRLTVQTFVDMKSELDSERRAMEARWNKRRKQLDQVELNIAGMYGELEGLMGGALPSVDVLELAPPTELGVAS